MPINNYRTRDNRGENHPRSILTEGDVWEIIKLQSEGLSIESISQKFGVSKSTVRSILAGKSWKHLKREKDANN
jgi:lambda repressor-like predicted transcriptional regulator